MAPKKMDFQLLTERIVAERLLRQQSEVFLASGFAEFKIELQRRLGELNHAHAQANEAAARTVPRELFDAFTKENEARREAALDSIKQTHRLAVETLHSKIDTLETGLGTQIEVERNARIRAEGSVAVWRFIAVFLGLPGLVALLLALLALFGPAPNVVP